MNNNDYDDSKAAHSLPELEFREELLSKASLRGYQCPPTDAAVDMVVLVHKSEGRIFLTDRNGFYNDLLADAWMKTNGNVVILLTSNRTPVAHDQCTN